MSNNIFEDQVKKELKNMDQRLYELEEKMTSIDTKLSQVVDAILGNPLTKSGGFIKDIEIMKGKIQELENRRLPSQKVIHDHVSCNNVTNHLLSHLLD